MVTICHKKVFEARYIYFKVSLFLEKFNDPLTPAFFKLILLEALGQMFGEAGKSIQVDVIKFRYQIERVDAIIRVPKKSNFGLHYHVSVFGEISNARFTFIRFQQDYYRCYLTAEVFKLVSQINSITFKNKMLNVE